MPRANPKIKGEGDCPYPECIGRVTLVTNFSRSSGFLQRRLQCSLDKGHRRVLTSEEFEAIKQQRKKW